MIFLKVLPRAALLIFVGLVHLTVSCVQKDPAYKDRTVVRVNKTTLTAEQLAEDLASRLRVFNSLSAKDSAVVTQAKKAAVQDFIVHVVTTDWAQQKQLFVRKEALDAAAQKIRAQYPDDIAFRKALADEGLTYSRWEDKLRFNLLEALVMAELRKSISPPTDEEIKKYYDSNKAQFQSPAAVKLRQVVADSDEKAQRLKKELSEGKTIASLAKKFSISSDAALGGDIGWVEKGAADFFDAVNRLNQGQRSNIIKTPFGYHIFEVTGKRSARTIPLDEAKSKISVQLTAEKEQALYTAWLEEQVLKAQVYKNDDFINQIQVQTRGIK